MKHELIKRISDSGCEMSILVLSGALRVSFKWENDYVAVGEQLQIDMPADENRIDGEIETAFARLEQRMKFEKPHYVK